jgi:hypothetical protein
MVATCKVKNSLVLEKNLRTEEESCGLSNGMVSAVNNESVQGGNLCDLKNF